MSPSLKASLAAVMVASLMLSATLVMLAPNVEAGTMAKVKRGDWTYDLKWPGGPMNFGGDAYVVGYSGPGGVVWVPETFWYTDDISFDVISIAANVFAGRQDITSIIFPYCLKSLGDGACSGCTGLTSVTFDGWPGNSWLASIGANAFSGCYALVSITLKCQAPATVGHGWIAGTNPDLRGHVYANTGYPSAGGIYLPWNGLTIGNEVQGCLTDDEVVLPEVRLRGSIVDSNGAAISGVSICLENGKGTISDSNGCFSLMSRIGNHTLTLSGAGIATRIIQTNSTDSPTLGSIDVGAASANSATEGPSSMYSLLVIVIVIVVASGIVFLMMRRRE